jgi:hypothetical protein
MWKEAVVVQTDIPQPLREEAWVNLTFMGPWIVRIWQYTLYPRRCNVTQFIISGKLLYMFRVVPPPIIRSAYNCIYNIWYLSHRYCYLPLSWKSWNWYECAVPTQTSATSSTIAAGSNNCETNNRCCRYSCMRSWWWVEVPLKTCRAASRYNKLYNVASCWIYIGIVWVKSREIQQTQNPP